MPVNRIKRLLLLGCSEIMSIRTRMIIIALYIVLNYRLTKTSDLTFIVCHNVRLQSCLMVATTSVRAPSWHDNVHACDLTHFSHTHYINSDLCRHLLFLAMAYFGPYVVPCLISGLFPLLTCTFISLFPLSPRCEDIFPYHFPLSLRCILSYILLYPHCIRLFILLSPCWTRFFIGLT